jgi:hypothetical protein
MKQAITGTASSNLLSVASGARSHGLRAGRKVKFPTLTGGTGLTAGTTYTVIPAGLTTRVFSVSASGRYGGAVDFSSNVTAGTMIRVTTGKGVDG